MLLDLNPIHHQHNQTRQINGEEGILGGGGSVCLELPQKNLFPDFLGGISFEGDALLGLLPVAYEIRTAWKYISYIGLFHMKLFSPVHISFKKNIPQYSTY